MEDANQHVESVQRVRHSFQPSTQLENALGTFIKPGYERPRFLINTLSSFVLNSIPGYSFDLYNAKRDVERRDAVDLQLGSHLATRRIGSGPLKLLFSLDTTLDEQNIDVNKVHYLAMMDRTSKLLAGAPRERDPELEKFTFYTVISGNMAIPEDEIVDTGMALVTDLRSTTAKRFYRISLDRLSSTNEESVHYSTYDTPLEEAS